MATHFKFDIGNSNFKIANLSNFLTDKCKFNYSFIGSDTVVFQQDNPIDYCKLICLTQNETLIDSAIDSVISLLKESETNYKVSQNTILKDDDIKMVDKQIEQHDLIKDKLEFLEKLLFWAHHSQLKDIIKHTIPHYKKLFNHFDIWFLEINPIINYRLSARRVFYSANEVPEVFNAFQQGKFPGFKSMGNLEEEFHVGLSLLTNQFFTVFPSYISGHTVDRLGGSFVLLFDKPTSYLSAFPWRFQDLVSHTTYFSEHRRFEDFKTYRKSSIENIDFDVRDISILLHDYINGLNKTFTYLLDPTNFSNGTDLDTMRWMDVYLTLSRIANETTIIQTEFMNNYIRKNLFFGIIDKLAQIISKHPTKQVVNATETFKSLLKKVTLHKIAEMLDKSYSKPFGNFFRNHCKKVMDDVYKSVLSGIFIPQRIKNDNIIVTPKSGKQQQYGSEEYVTQFLREIRNTHHGYAINKPEFLSINNCNLTNRISILATYLWLSLLQYPKEILEGHIL